MEKLVKERLKFWQIIILYIFIYNPVFRVFEFGLSSVLLLISLFYAFRNICTIKKYLIYYKKECYIITFILIYLSVIFFINNSQDKEILKTIITWFLFTTFIPIYINEKVIGNIKRLDIIDIILKVGAVAACVTLLELFIPAFHTLIRSIQTSREIENYYADTAMHRGYGLAINLSSAYGMVQGSMAAISLLKWEKNNNIYLLLSFILALSASVNARTGLFPFLLAIIYKVVSILRQKNRTLILYCAIGIIVSIPVINYLIKKMGDTAEFVLSFFESVFSAASGGDLNELDWFNSLERFIHFPDSWVGWIFGEGYSLFGLEAGFGSDIGFINQIFLGGLIFVSLLLYYQYTVYKKMYMAYDKDFTFILLFISVCIFNFKGLNFYVGSAVPNMIMLIYFNIAHKSIHNVLPYYKIRK